MRLLVALLLLLVAVPAHAQKKIGLIGDSHIVGGTSFASLGSFLARWSLEVTIRDLLKHASGPYAAAIVENWGIPGTSQDDWGPAGPSEASLCVGQFDPWICCTGAGTGNACICDSDVQLPYYPHLRSACRDRKQMTTYLPADVDLWILIPDGSPAGGDAATQEAIEAAVDNIEALRDWLDAIDTGDGVVVTSPFHFDGGCLLGVFSYDAVYAEMVERDIITPGYDLYDYPPLTRCPDFIHPSDVGYAQVGDSIARPLMAEGES